MKRAPHAAVLHLGLIGADIRRSPSPAMHRAALEARGLPGDYALLEVSGEELPAVVRRLRSGELKACNVTAPYKLTLALECDRLEGDAAVCRAVNSLRVEDGEVVGDNTDARGFELAMTYLRLIPEPGAPGLVLGAGGAAAAVVLALRRMGVRPISVVARRPERAVDLCLRVAPENARPVAWDQGDLVGAAARAAGVVVNATPLSAAQLPISVEALSQSCVVADLRYHPRPVDLVAAAQARGLRSADGVEMLLFQGMLSFQRWTGVDPPWHAAREALVAALAG